MNILDYAPVDFQEHLKALDNTINFYKVRLRCELESDSDHQASSSLQHYVLTGNEGVGIPEAIDEIRNRLIGIYNITEYIYRDATTMYDFNEGFESSMNEVRRLSKPLLSILDRTCARLSFFEIISTIRI